MALVSLCACAPLFLLYTFVSILRPDVANISRGVGPSKINRIDLSRDSWLSDHKIFEFTLFPGIVFRTDNYHS